MQFQCPHGLELLQLEVYKDTLLELFQCPHGLELLHLALIQKN